MLDRAMESRTQLSETEVDVLKKEYIDRLTTANIIFGPKPFLLPPDEKDRIRISAALYDATLVALHRLWGQREKFVADAPAIRERLQNEFKHEANGPIITGQANTAQAVRDRIGIAQRVLTGVAG
ncbi:hypothetical protein X747_09435 [Mesorhizobium sp. LNJC384A00]|nr:hypothetical protein X747_09435 [Mesorhizobium sp. LNJC384A00]